jgi:hypothetical protein
MYLASTEMIQAPVPHAADELLTDGIGLWCSHRSLEHLNLTVFGHSGEALAIFAVIVSDQETGSLTIRGHFPDLLSNPNIAG